MAHLCEFPGRLSAGAFGHTLLSTNHPSTMPVGCDLMGRRTILSMAVSSLVDQPPARSAQGCHPQWRDSKRLSHEHYLYIETSTAIEIMRRRPELCLSRHAGAMKGYLE